MKIDPRYLAVGRLFSEQNVFTIPKYQRNYSWDTPQIEDFLNDIQMCYEARRKDKQLNHFFGGIITIINKVQGSSRRNCELVDGQQRLTTFIIFVHSIIAFYEALSNLAKKQNDSNNQELATRRANRLRYVYITCEDEVNRELVKINRIELSAADKLFFNAKLSDISVQPTRESHKRLENAFDLIKRKIELLIDSENTMDKKIDVLWTLELILNDDCTLIALETDSKEEAYRIFQVINDRGETLTVGDLLRAKTLELLDDPTVAHHQETIEGIWDHILEDHPDKTDSFLKWIYSSYKGKRPGSASLFDDFRKAFFDFNSPLDTAQAHQLVENVTALSNDIITCRKLKEGDWPYQPSSEIKNWDRNRLRLLVVELGHTHCLPLLLAASSRLSEKYFSQIVQILERFFFRYKIICNLHINPLSKIYLDEALKIRTQSDSYKPASLIASLQPLQQKASDILFTSNLDLMVYKPSEGNKTLRYFLLTTEHYLDWFNQGAHGSPQCKDKSTVHDFLNTTIEHIYPRSSTNPDPSIVPIVDTIGNLSILDSKINETLDNRDFTLKMKTYAESSFALNREIATHSTWGRDDILKRAERLKAIAQKVFLI